MKKHLLILILAPAMLFSSCSKDNSELSGAPVSTEDEAEAVLVAINNLWTTVLKPQLTKKAQTYSDTVLSDGAGGKATVNGHYDYSTFSSSSSNSVNSEIDVQITFQQYVANGLHLNGTLRFYDSYYSRTACSSSGCASSTHTDVVYSSSDGNSNDKDFPPITIAFKNAAGKSYKDNILLYVGKEYAHWEGKLINARNQTISISY